MESFNIFQALSIQTSFKVQDKIHILNLRDHFRENFTSLKCKNLPTAHLNSLMPSSDHCIDRNLTIFKLTESKI